MYLDKNFPEKGNSLCKGPVEGVSILEKKSSVLEQREPGEKSKREERVWEMRDAAGLCSSCNKFGFHSEWKGKPMDSWNIHMILCNLNFKRIVWLIQSLP